jgi:hypothetical protein
VVYHESMPHRGVSAAEKYAEGPKPLCECHGESMRWQKNAGGRVGGNWRCAVNRPHRAVLAAEKALEGPAPLCPCHSEPMLWNAQPTHAGGSWRCRIVTHEYQQRYSSRLSTVETYVAKISGGDSNVESMRPSIPLR